MANYIDAGWGNYAAVDEVTFTVSSSGDLWPVTWYYVPAPTVDEMLASLRCHIAQGLQALRIELGQARGVRT